MIYTVTLNPAIDREYIVPNLAFDTVLRAEAVRSDPGGKGFNVSRMLMTLGQPSVALGFVGGKAGEWLEGRLAALGIGTQFVPIHAETRTNTTVVLADGTQHLKANEKGPEISAMAQDEMLMKVNRLAKPGEWWVLAGSLPPGVPLDFYAQLIQTIRVKGGRVILDTSGDSLKESLVAQPDWIKPNLTELLGVTGKDDLSAALLTLAEWEIGQLVVSLGKDGALLVDSGGSWRLASPEISEKNPIGAGDALVGGFVWGLHQSLAPAEAVRWGMACGALAASKAGTDFGTRAEVEALVAQVSPFEQA
ncbi:MAG: 1-phosphofructokinase family hexose kinase [Sphaerospermopsis sp. SIO1G2]|nr:1-phosphofructokinase family hexose kinase [Sphaerospermopsis sp. SIO1G2]